jgi:oxygen-dependent protoporphyrinogen oxidase
MIGRLDPKQKEVTIVGAGISGLLMGYALKKSGYQVKILEACSRAGGLIQTISTPFGIAEKAAHSLLVTPEIKKLFEELKVPLEQVNAKSRARFIYRNGKMRKMPLRLSEILQTIVAFFSKPKGGFDRLNGSLEEWGHAYVGIPATRFLLTPFVTGIFATSPKELLARLAFPKLVPESPKRSLFKHFRSGTKSVRPVMMAPRFGMQSLIDALERELKAELQLNTSVSTLDGLPSFKPLRNSVPNEIQTDALGDISKENVSSALQNTVLTVPSQLLSSLIKSKDPSSAEALLKIRYAPLISVTCFYKTSAFQKEPRGVGVLIPRGENIRMLGCLFNSSSFSGRSLSPEIISLTVMYGGTEDQSVTTLTDGELTQLIHREIETVLGARSDSLHLEITRWERAIPIYNSDLDKAQQSVKLGFASHPGAVIYSNFSKDVSIRGLINATLHI